VTCSSGPTARASARLEVGTRRIPVVLHRWGDPRLKLAIVLLTVQVLGQTRPRLQAVHRADPGGHRRRRRNRDGRDLPASPGRRMAGQRDAHREQHRLAPAGQRHRPRRLVEHLNGIEYFVLAVALSLADQVPHPPRRKSPLQPVQRDHGHGEADGVVLGNARHPGRLLRVDGERADAASSGACSAT
jgi:hypothetical protein